MTDLSQTIIAKSDQLNADDLIGRSITIEINKVSGVESKEQPISIHYKGDENKPWKPCKSMRRVLVFVWGKDGAAYVGKKLTLYRDEKVKFGGIEVGGIRISHMSGITEPMTMALTASKANKKPFTVKPLIESDDGIKDLKRMGEIQAKKGIEALKTWWGGLGAERQNKLGAGWLADMKKIANAAQGANNELPVDPISDKADEVSDQITNHQQEG